MPSWSFLAAVAIAPMIVVLRSPAAARGTLVTTVTASWLASTAIAAVYPRDPSDIAGQIILMLALLPLVLVPVATFVATRLAQRPHQRMSAAMLAVLGWGAGLAVMILVPVYGAQGELWDRALGVLAPAVYASCGATYAATR